MPAPVITPYVGMVDLAIRFKSNPLLWLCIGRTTPWPDENAPPDVTDTVTYPQYLNMTVPEEPIALKKIDFAGLCVPDANGQIRYQNQRFSYVPDVNAVSLLARWVYVRASLDYIETNSVGTVIVGSDIAYRQASLLSGVVPQAPYANESTILASQVQDFGRVVCVTNFPPRQRNPRKRDVLEFIREMRG
jgi:hypothetical protein